MKDSLPKPVVITDKCIVVRSKKPEAIDPCTAIDRNKLKNPLAFQDYLRAIDQYRTTGIGAYGLEAFTACNDAGIYPPSDLLGWLSIGFKEWLDKEEVELEKVLGLGKITSGNTPSLDKRNFQERDDSIVLEILQLMESFGVSQDDAAAMVAARMKADFDPDPLEASTISSEIFPKLRRLKKERGYSFRILDDKGKLELLAQYPEHAKYYKKIRDFISPTFATRGSDLL